MTLAYAGDWPARIWQLLPWSGRVQVVHHELAVLPTGADRVRLAFASDLHFGPTTAPRTLAAAAELLRAARPDAVLLGGDYVFLAASPRRCAALKAWAATLDAPVKLAVMGNHDLWADHAALEAALVAAGVRMLTNDAMRIGPHVAVIGIDDPWTGAPEPGRAFAAAGDALVRVVLCHAAEGLPLVESERPAVFLCGHTHGGQLATPWGAVWVPGAVGRRYVAGLHRVGETWLHISRGVGGVEVSPRTWAVPDIAVLDLVARA